MSFDGRTSPHIQVDAKEIRARRYRSLRWRILTPLVVVLLIIMMVGVYGVAYAFIEGDSAAAEEDLLTVSESVADNAINLGNDQRNEVTRIAFTIGVPEAVAVADSNTLQDLVEPLAALADLDLVLIGDINANEVLGMQRVIGDNDVDYAVTNETDLTDIPAMTRVLNGAENASSFVTIDGRPMLVTAGRIVDGEEFLVGTVAIGMDVNSALSAIQGGNNADLALFVGQRQMLGNTFADLPALELPDGIYDATLDDPDATTTERLTFSDIDYRAAYFPFVTGETPLGIIAAYQEDTGTAAANLGRQMLSLVMATIAGALVIVGYVVLGRQVARLEKVTDVAQSLAAGEMVRTNMKPKDEIGQMGAALDRYAAAANVQLQQVQSDLRQQRRQTAHLQSVLENLPDGIIVQDAEGRVMVMNANARSFMGAYGDTQEALSLKEWSAQVAQKIGDQIAPGMYEIGQEKQIKVDNRILNVQAAAVRSIADKHLGTVLVLRDISEEVEHGAKRDELIEQIASDVNVSMEQRAQAAALEAGTRKNQAYSDTLMKFAREISGDARSLQRMITEYRDLTLLKPNELRERAHPIDVAELLLQLMELWQPAALASDMTLGIALPDEDLHVLGDERRLLMALGYLMDNSIKYGLAGASIQVKVRPQIEQSRLEVVLMDTGVGIAPEDLGQVFIRFYRGKPIAPDGTPITVMGTGQGLYLAQKIIEAHGGTIALASTPGEGTYVTITLPLTADVSFQLPDEVSSRTPQAVVRKSAWDEPTSITTVAEVPRRTIDRDRF